MLIAEWKIVESWNLEPKAESMVFGSLTMTLTAALMW